MSPALRSKKARYRGNCFSGVEAVEAALEVPVAIGADAAPVLRKARTVGQIKVKAVSSETLLT